VTVCECGSVCEKECVGVVVCERDCVKESV
jgi:hypothetical protein